MNQCSPSEWLIVGPALRELFALLHGHVKLVEKLDREFRPKPPEAGDPIVGGATNQLEPLMYSAFREADEVLRGNGRVQEADNVLRHFGRSWGNASKTRDYVKALFRDLNPSPKKQAVVTQPSPPGAGQEEAEDTIPPDGPVAPDAFCWDGVLFAPMQRIPWRLVARLWDAHNKSGDIDDLASPVWDKRVGPALSRDAPPSEYPIASADLPENAVRSAQSKVNHFFQANRIPYRLQTRDRGRYLTLRRTDS